jgi:hypothetical protein
MAQGDYVRTFAGALAQGAQAIVASILNRGGSGTEAAAALRSTFQRLPQPQIASLISSVSRGLSAGQSRFAGGVQFGPPALLISARGNQPTPQEALIRVIATTSGGNQVVTHHTVQMSAGETLASAMERAKRTAGIIFGNEQYPELSEEADEEPITSVEAEVEVVYQRAGG